MPKKAKLKDDQSVARYLPRRSLIIDPKTKEIRGCFPSAFKLRPGETYLSAHWVEHYAGGAAKSVSAISTAMASTGFDTQAGSGFAVGTVGAIRAVCQPAQVSAVHSPKHKRPAYTEVWNIPQEDDAKLARLGLTAWSQVFPN